MSLFSQRHEYEPAIVPLDDTPNSPMVLRRLPLEELPGAGLGICEGCPNARAIEERRKEMSEKGVCPGELMRFDFELEQLEAAATQTRCGLKAKELPEVFEPVPPFGVERMDFARLCPAFNKFVELREG